MKIPRHTTGPKKGRFMTKIEIDMADAQKHRNERMDCDLVKTPITIIRIPEPNYKPGTMTEEQIDRTLQNACGGATLSASVPKETWTSALPRTWHAFDFCWSLIIRMIALLIAIDLVVLFIETLPNVEHLSFLLSRWIIWNL